MSAMSARGPVLFPLLLVLAGVVLLLDNFLLLQNFNVIALWPLLLVAGGAVILLRGDFTIDDVSRTFGVTRGSVESATVEINAGEIDVTVRDVPPNNDPAREERLIAGQYAANTRPALVGEENHANIRLDRAASPWFNTAPWELALAQDLPWGLFISTHLGEVELDLSRLIVDGSMIATGIGDIHITCPQETLAPVQLRSALGSIQFTTPLGYKARIQVNGPRTLTVRVDERRYALAEKNLYIARNADPDAPLVDVQLSGTFGDIYLA
ncbi:MAG: hypothetical protein AAF125_11370 [Chloroflexota bacterium]